MQGMPSILSLFRIEFNKFNYTGGTNVRFYLSHDIEIILKSYFWLEKSYYFAICITLKLLLYPPQTLFVVGYTVFTLSVRPCVRPSVRNVLFS